jgi:hypothetical protein
VPKFLKLLSAVLIMLLIITVAYVVYSTQIGIITLYNQSSELIKTVTITTSGKIISVISIPRMSKRSLWFWVTQEGHHNVVVNFESGKTLERNIGYTTPNFGNRDDVIVTDQDIVSNKRSSHRVDY